jgi:hypothetical protein
MSRFLEGATASVHRNPAAERDVILNGYGSE